MYVVTGYILFSFCAYDSLSPNFEVFSIGILWAR